MKKFYWFLGICLITYILTLYRVNSAEAYGYGAYELLPVLLLGLPWSLFLDQFIPKDITLSPSISVFIMLCPLYLNLLIVMFIYNKFSKRGSNIIH